MRILLFGKNGQLGWELQRSLAPLGEVIALGTHDQPCADFTRPSDVAATVRALAPDVIVNAAAYTAVDKAESEPQVASEVNAVTPGVLAEAVAGLGAWLVHYSTDYVFDGTGVTPWREDSPTNPVNEYGRSKLAGEENIRASGCRHLIFRTSWVYAARGGNFAKTMLKLAQERDALKVIDDQFGAPTGADLLADITSHALRAVMNDEAFAGTYHAVAAGETNWHGYARHVIARARAAGVPVKVADDAIQAVPTSEFPTPARRPANSRLDTHKLRNAFGLHLPDWRMGVDRMLTELLEK
ncbi:dTDP-4-dehydrorhamnose reductase [Yanghanlia caeni]|uniref:dTDP-4-dehydrorhamnose reductase n=1 Tax=Yanghanlia caeni TaxID=3064283 RepID=A0ABU1D509_9BURK|nr:dTDP-4-dehydrorhamnose reductase [Alcaligenaceae bacterium LG-2]